MDRAGACAMCPDQCEVNGGIPAHGCYRDSYGHQGNAYGITLGPCEGTCDTYSRTVPNVQATLTTTCVKREDCVEFGNLYPTTNVGTVYVVWMGADCV